MAELIGNSGCKEAGCDVGISGECFNSLQDPDKKCPHFYWLSDLEEDEREEEEDEENKESIEDQPKPPATVRLLSGDDLSAEDITAVTNRFNTKLIFLIGESDAGKTTALASIFDMFQLNDFENYSFAGSMTQIAFERRCHKSRKESNLPKPKIDKTSALKFSFLHIATKHKHDHTPIRHYLLSDISGEKIAHAASSSTSMQELQLLKKADLIIVVIDGEKVADLATRQAIINQSLRFIQKALDEEMINNNTKIVVALSKVDLLATITDFDFDKKIKIPFEAKFKGKVGALIFNQIASRPNKETSAIKLGHGLEQILDLLHDLYSSAGVAVRYHYGYGNRCFSNYQFRND